MKSTIRLVLASALAVTSLSGIALAQTASPMADSTTTGSVSATTDGVTVIRLDSLDNDQNRAEHTRLAPLANSENAMAQAQSEAASDPAIMQALEAQNVEPGNVFHIQNAANGGKIVYIR